MSFQRLFHVALVAGLAATSVACTETNSTIFIRQVVVPEDEECVYEPDPSGTFLLEGTYDFAIPDSLGSDQPGYFGALLVGNQLQKRGDADTLRNETGRVQLYEIEVQVFSFDGALLSEYSQPTSGFIDPANGTEPGYGVTGGTLVDPVAIDAVRNSAFPTQRVVSRVKIFGTTTGGEDVETAEWDFPVTVCEGCIGCIEPESCEDDKEGSCLLAQDKVSDCRLINASTVCPNG
jgi:hypothetical protein